MNAELDENRWDSWRPEEAAQRFAGVQAPWYVAAGWAIDLFLGRERREHEDLDLAVPEPRFAEVADRFPMLRFCVVGPGLAVPVDEEQLAWDEVGKRMERTPDGARMLGTRALERLRELMGECNGRVSQ